MEKSHVLVRNPRLKGWEYGMLRALEAEIVSATNAEVTVIPEYETGPLLKRAGHGMRLNPARKVLKKGKFTIQGDVMWHVLMGPEDFDLDLFSGWQDMRYRIVYLFDTLVPQFPVIKKLFSGNEFNILITSFSDAVPQLEALTGRKWYAVEQAVPDNLFHPVPLEERTIHFSSYGRRWPVFHDALYEFCEANGLYYDFTTHDARHPTAPPPHLYRQYAWHMNRSLFTVSWPVELTNPARAGNMHPVTCRWFEAAAAGTILLGKKPGNPDFDQYIAKDLVADIDPTKPKEEIFKQLDKVWSNRQQLHQYAQDIAHHNKHKLGWKERVARMLQILDTVDPS